MEHCHQHHTEKHLNDNLDSLPVAEKDNYAANICSVCSLSFAELSELHLHMEKSHGQASQKESETKQKSYECPDCGKCYVSVGYLINHQRSHTPAAKSLFNNLKDLKKKSFNCEFCGRTYSRASALDAHRRYHKEKLVKSKNRNSGDVGFTDESVVDDKPKEIQKNTAPGKHFNCECGKSFTALIGLKTHRRFCTVCEWSPEGRKEKMKKTYHCNDCQKEFGSFLALLNHQRWHAKQSGAENKFKCEECGKTFVSSTFYNKHKRLFHSGDTAAKSFTNQVTQLQKKSFECQECGLKFSRASALNSHQLHHRNVFGESEINEIKNVEQYVESRLPVDSHLKEDHPAVYDTEEEDGLCYGPGDFNVQVISASESDSESVHEPNPDLELLCESDQEMRDSGTETSRVSKSAIDLNIVQVDFEQAEEPIEPQASQIEGEATQMRFNCPECYRWFTSAGSLSIHRMWHRIRRKRQQNQPQSTADVTSDTGSTVAPQCSDTQHGIQDPSEDVMNQAEELEKKDLTCGECGQNFSNLSTLVSHQLHHPKRKRFQCPDCLMSFLHAAGLFNHMKNCPSAHTGETISVTQREYNPKKTLLGPKSFYCKQCGKGFWSLGAYSHHLQNQKECAELRQRKGDKESLHSVHRHSRSTVKVACPVCGRKFRHKGIMKLHMRKHENGNHKCDLCPRSFRLFSSLLRHQVVHNDQLLPPPIKSFQHQVEQLKKNSYSCPDCGKLFSRAKALQFHMKSHGYETGLYLSSPRSSVMLVDHQCATCLAHFNSKTSLQAHQKQCIRRENRALDDQKDHLLNNDTLTIHDDNLAVSSQGGSKHWSVNTEVKQEIDSKSIDVKGESPTSDMKYKCNMCDKSFSIVGALNLHQRIHSGRYATVPKAKVALSVMLKKPKPEELGKRKFYCTDCGRHFLSNAALGSHKRLHKGKKNSQSRPKADDLKSASYNKEVGSFHCNTCGKHFFNQRVFQRHQMLNPRCRDDAKTDSDKNTQSVVALQNVKLACSQCNETFVQKSLLAAHCRNEHGIMLEAVYEKDRPVLDPSPEQGEVSLKRTESSSLAEKRTIYQCHCCSMSFAKEKSLGVHLWQVHLDKSNSPLIVSLGSQEEPISESCEVQKTEEPSALDYSTKKHSCDENGDKSVELAELKCLDCETNCISAQSLRDHKELCTKLKQSLKQEDQSSEVEVSPLSNHLLEASVKCFYKCNMCGKAFQTEEHLSNHKTKAKSRPYCCALCCHGFWTESQLQQHLTWHDEVRGRLPNEVRYRLSAAVASSPRKSKVPSPDNKVRSCPSSTLNQATPKSENHLQSSHKCQRCGKAFLSPTALQKHETQHCNNDLYHCSICPRTFSEIQELIDHHQECIGDYNYQ